MKNYIVAQPVGPGANLNPNLCYKPGFFFAAKSCDDGEAFSDSEVDFWLKYAESIIEKYDIPGCKYRVSKIACEEDQK